MVIINLSCVTHVSLIQPWRKRTMLLHITSSGKEYLGKNGLQDILKVRTMLLIHWLRLSQQGRDMIGKWDINFTRCRCIGQHIRWLGSWECHVSLGLWDLRMTNAQERYNCVKLIMILQRRLIQELIFLICWVVLWWLSYELPNFLSWRDSGETKMCEAEPPMLTKVLIFSCPMTRVCMIQFPSIMFRLGSKGV